ILLNEKDPTSVYPKNFYTNPPYRGPITVTEAIQRSTNTIPVKLVQLLSPRTSFNFMKDQLGFKNLVESKTIGGKVYSDVDLAPMALGAMTGGVTPLEMAGAYQMFGNGGYYYKPHSYTRVLDAEGNVILENKTLPQRVLTPETATIMNKLMQRVTNAAPGTGTPAKFSDMPIAGKTGTSDQDYNQWFIGVTPYYVGVCWLGYDEMATINYSGYSYPPPIIWKNVMGPIHSKLAVKGFETMGNVVERTYCLETGNLAGPLCPTTAVGWYKLSNEPPVCDAHKPKEEAVTPSGPEGDMDYWDWLYGGEGLASDTDDED
ncbi:MAG: penicillin-binding transpeptidase domain-containing protein, partial [Oscillibacter sp.]